MTKRAVYIWCQWLGWSLYGLLNFGIYFIQSGAFSNKELVIAIWQILFYILSSHTLRWVIKRQGWVGYPIVKLLPTILGSTLVLGMINYLLLLTVTWLMMGTVVWSIELRTVNMIFGVLGPAMMYCLWSLIYFTYHFFEQYNKSLQYEAAIREAELQHLRSQLNPHFIFNALNSIKALVDENPIKSKQAITQLSSIFRNTLNSEKKKLVRLEEEMETVRAYLGLESIRFEERLEVTLEVADETLLCQIPPMMIQTLVENGVKHGISKLKNGGTVSLLSQVKGENLVIQIRNSGKYKIEEVHEDGHGRGLQNTKDRLYLIYGDRANLTIDNEDDTTVLTKITLPKEY
ncbi:sensor histidine kinase [Reichenbachiella sp. MSK19-1]|uniref:sensor histidine kinase n=1 Tax=Reichenbachiella sp. MSK19-1 TaxID=1897631 RepID=UPI000E6B8169|nr:histidine kinase [Reichenbachiella sp. MSK19-1]RJE71308.1 hypothetical protein BGP76_04210 [Reichenbachiella sp. MSK19-1]